VFREKIRDGTPRLALGPFGFPPFYARHQLFYLPFWFERYVRRDREVKGALIRRSWEHLIFVSAVFAVLAIGASFKNIPVADIVVMTIRLAFDCCVEKLAVRSYHLVFAYLSGLDGGIALFDDVFKLSTSVMRRVKGFEDKVTESLRCWSEAQLLRTDPKFVRC